VPLAVTVVVATAVAVALSLPLFWLYVVILRACDFFDFSQKAALKTTGLDVKKSSYRNKVTSSEQSEESLILWSRHCLEV
jgi:hypothetical protein